MYTISEKNERVTILLHEIYGVNKYIHHFANRLSQDGMDVVCPDLLGGNVFSYEQQAEAYQYFMTEVGFERAAAEMKDLIQSLQTQYKEVYLVGFSIGATVAWLCSEQEGISGIVGYSGTRIRDYLDITPECRTLLLFARYEASVNVDSMIPALTRKQVEVVRIAGSHGFADVYAPTYTMHSSNRAYALVTEFFAKKSRKIIS
ncbi:dienelactone hydrolase family protein [Solibacillus sp. FSL H8-0538]|uniref:dienelactone hydrolase family protein n=1 Tax=Solibacillus sp. FSL H8-0538 TaxID=2921400 RepID=UPI0030F6168C